MVQNQALSLILRHPEPMLLSRNLLEKGIKILIEERKNV